MIITSSAFDDGATIPKKFTCDGGDINPELLIQNVPSEAKSLALIMYDPDAPVTGGYAHWIAWNIDPATTIIKEESVPPGSIEGKNGGENPGYAGPCPPPGAPHHYHFSLYALDGMLALPEDATMKALHEEMDGHILAHAELVGLYERS